MALEADGDNVAGSALKMSNQLGDALAQQRESFHTVGVFQAIQTPTTPRSKSTQS